MRRLIAVGLLLGFSGLNVAQGELIVHVGTHDFLPGEVRTIALVVTGGSPVAGLDLYIQFGDGGEVNSGVDTKPILADVDIIGQGTIFHLNNTGQQPEDGSGSSPLLWAISTTTVSGTVAAEGIFAWVTIDTTGTAPGESYSLRLKDVMEGILDPDTASTTFSSATGDPLLVDITDGTIRIVPEPSVVVLLSSLLPCLALVFWHRRRTARR